jgi:hypothetical protein
MTHLAKISAWAFHTFFALTLLIAAAGSAAAEVVLLTCQGMGAPSFVVRLDMDKRAVFNTHGLGKRWYPAQITDEEIHWDENPDLWFRYTLNRITGNLQQIGTSGGAQGFLGQFQCSKAQRQF